MFNWHKGSFSLLSFNFNNGYPNNPSTNTVRQINNSGMAKSDTYRSSITLRFINDLKVKVKSWKLKKKIKKITIPILTTLVGALTFLTSKKHVIPIIVRIELIILSLISIASQTETSKATIVLSILTIIVSEGVTGISLILKTAKAKGNDLTNNSII